ncbi:HEPN domain-containing protein [Candidatus Sumerlaeota bacterium]|nr:HEPN domain-containing protein [Candidatus Sumerlaeota bacterium]
MSAQAERDLITYRLEQAHKAIEEATLLCAAGHLLGTVNRAYYAMFYAAQALLVPTGLKTSKHSGVIALFDREFVQILRSRLFGQAIRNHRTVEKTLLEIRTLSLKILQATTQGVHGRTRRK